MSQWDTPAWRRGVAWGATALALWLLFWPFGQDDRTRGVPGFDKAVHVGLFGGLAWAWGRALGAAAMDGAGRRSRWLLAAALGAMTVAVEVLQPLTGRGCEPLDVFAGCVGIAATTVLRGRGFGISLAVLAALAGAFMEKGAWNLGAEWRAFPTLAAGGGGCWAEDWHLRGVDGQPVDGGLRLTPSPDGPETWRGAFRVPIKGDWRAWGDWILRVEWGGAADAMLVVRLDDRREKEPAYGERFQREWRVSPGWNELSIPRSEWTRTSGGGELDASDIARWGVFLLNPDDFEFWTLGKTELLPQNERETP